MIINERFKVVFFRVGCVCVREGGGERETQRRSKRDYRLKRRGWSCMGFFIKCKNHL